MPVKKSAYKALRQDKKRGERNLNVKMDLKTTLKKTRKLMGENPSAEELKTMVSSVIKQADKAAQKRVIKKNKAANIKSRLLRDVNEDMKKSLFAKKEKASA